MFNNPFDQILMHCDQYPPNNLVNMVEKTWKPNIEIAPNCPRCASSNTKFCYYNNYSLSQPRYFCKGCRRYWTKGGSLRNVPVGGGCRKNRRSKAVKLPQRDRSSSLSGYNSNSSQDPNEFSSQKSGADIDLALVFANFLSPKCSSSTSFDQQTSSDNNSSPNDIGIAEIQTQPNFVQEEGNLVIPPEKILDEGNFGHEFELQNLEMCEQDVGLNDAFWCDIEAMSSFNSSQLQDVDFFPSDGGDDDRLQISTNENLINENWSSFDFSGFEVFSRY